jgi:YD repeat-containing protein
MTVIQVFNTRGAARRLGCSEAWIHKLVAQGKLRAYTYDENGELVERRKDRKSQGQGLYFFARDVDQYQPAVQRRPRGSKNKKLPMPDTPSKMG